MNNLMESVSSTYMGVTKMTLFNYIKTDNPVFNAIISTIQQNLGAEKKIQVFSMDTFNNISNDNTVLTLKMSSDNNDSVKVLALEFNM